MATTKYGRSNQAMPLLPMGKKPMPVPQKPIVPVILRKPSPRSKGK